MNSTKSPPTPVWRMVRRNRVNRAGEPTYDIISGGINPENWDMICDKATERNATLIVHAPALLASIKELLLLVDDFMPNIGRCALQNYQRLNEAPMNARALLAQIEEG